MGINFSHEYKKFEKEQQKLRQEYLAAGMSEGEIQEMYEFDKKSLDRDLAYWRRTQPISCVLDDMESESQNQLLYKFSEILTCDIAPSKSERFWWINEVESEMLVKAIKSLEQYELETLDLLSFSGMTQAEIADELGVDQSTISYRIKRIKEKIKKYGFHT